MATMIHDPECSTLVLADMGDWHAFWADNAEALDMAEDAALALACGAGLMVGGGAAPLFTVVMAT